MLLHKYKSPRPLEHLFDILSEKRLHCPKYCELNDPFEGRFLAMEGGGPPLSKSLPFKRQPGVCAVCRAPWPMFACGRSTRTDIAAWRWRLIFRACLLCTRFHMLNLCPSGGLGS